jgi:hypothetical protein
VGHSQRIGRRTLRIFLILLALHKGKHKEKVIMNLKRCKPQSIREGQFPDVLKIGSGRYIMFTQTYQCRVTLEKSGHLSWSQRVLYFDNSLIFKDVMECRNDKLFIIIIFFVLPSRSYKKNEENDAGNLVF